jgi:hypothetical protein
MATNVCLGIIRNERFLCDQDIAGGVNDRLVLINKSDWDAAAKTYDSDGRITNIVFAVGATAFVFEGKNNSVAPEQSLVKQKYSEQYAHKIAFIVFNTGQLTKNNLQNMARNKQVAIVQNNNNTFEVYGQTQGLQVLTNARVLQDLETGGAFKLELGLPGDVNQEPKLPADLLVTDFLTTLAKVNTLLGYPTITSFTPTTSAVLGGTSIVITGTHFAGAINVLFGTTPATSFTVDSDTQITAVSPALVAGAYKITVDGAAGKVTGSGTLTAS